MERPPGGAGDTERTIVLYDRDCGFCRWTLAGLLALDAGRRLRPVPLQDSLADRLLPGMSSEHRLSSAHVVTADGRAFSGGDAVAPLLRELPGGAPLSVLPRLAPALPRLAYGFVAGRRGAIGRRLPRRWVERATRRIDAHG